MPTYVSLWNFTTDGITNVHQSPDRLDEAKGLFEALGGELRDFYLTMGQYDAVAIMEMPDAETATQAGITISGAGAVRAETLRAFPEAGYRELIGGLP